MGNNKALGLVVALISFWFHLQLVTAALIPGLSHRKNGDDLINPIITQEDILKEARLILPHEDNNQSSLIGVKDELEVKLLEGFGGFTRLDGVGGWRNDNGTLHHEAVWIYDIAAPTTDEDGDPEDDQTSVALFEIAEWVKEIAKQESVFLRLPSGRVHFV